MLNRTLADRQRAILARLKIDAEPVGDLARVPPGDHLVILDHVFFTRRALVAFLARTRDVPGDAVLALPDSAYCREKRPLQDDLIVEPDETGGQRYVFGVFRMRRPADTLDELRARARRAVIPFKERVIVLPGLDAPGDEIEVLPGKDARGSDPESDMSYALSLWSHVLDIHVQALFESWADLDAGKILSYLGRSLAAFPWTRWRIARRLVYRGRNCDVHPSAVVEASVLGDGVRIGPRAVVRGSVIGDGATVAEHSEILFSAVGDRCHCAFRSRAAFSVVYPHAVISNPAVQLCVVGEGAVQTLGCYPIDMKLNFRAKNTEVSVLHHGRVVGSGKKGLGACFGHRSVVGSGIWLNCGLEIPNGAILVRDPDDVVRPTDAAAPPDVS